MVKCFVILLSIVLQCYGEKYQVVTRKGLIVGDRHDEYTTFLGIPYAKVNEENPFGATLEYPKFDRPYIANDSSVICPQVYFNDNGTIQCLQLNIYAPNTASRNNLMPILVWFHGGGFAFGSGGEYGGKYLVKKNIIVITVNYRLGAYGFLCLDNPQVPGNQGMKDQIEALRWIRSHIVHFGGDANKVTIAGESYGGGAVDIHLYSKYETLFHKAIVQSGSVYVTEGIFVKPDYHAAIKLVTNLGYDVTTTREALRILAKLNPTDVNAATRNMSMVLTLCAEKQFKGVQNFITENPFALQNSDRIDGMPIMIGYTSQEMLFEFANKPQSFYDNMKDPFTVQIEKTFALSKKELEKISSIVRHFYLGYKDLGPEVELELSNFLSDFSINYGAEWSTNRYVEQGATVFKYLFSYTGASEYMNITDAGASHTEELKYLFDWIWAAPLRNPEQLMMRERMIRMWANFVKYGEESDKNKLLTARLVRWLGNWLPCNVSRSYLVQPNFQKPFFANDSSIYCPQVTTRFGGDLQCLRLNLYVPHTANVNSTVPVLVWFYGGGFVFGSAQDYGGEHLVKHDIIVVTVNYRLGPYGFMCLNDPSVPGNQGLKDQIGALRWVSKNIEAFGGDPTKVTIAGESYGGGAVELHLYSKYETLFHKVIIQSGSIYTPGFYGNRDHDTAIKLAHQLGYKAANTREALQILSKESSVLVMNAAKNLGLKMSACKEVRFKGIQQFVTKCINHLINPDRIENIPIMIGYNSKEDFATYANKQQEFFDNLGDIFYKNLQNHFVLKTCELETLSNITRNFYLGSKKIGLESVLELSDYSSDFKLNYAVEKSVTKLLEQGGKVYKYMFSYIGGSIYQNITGVGAVHTEELKYLFETGAKLTSDEQRMMRDRMTAMWANFVKLGNPTPQKTDLLPVTWEPVTGNARQYLDIDVTMSMKDYAYRQRIAFWDLFMQKYDKKS
ncbi:unnamed protein product [Spodoptera exigua]|nr:unnamed protein product [Spodoptera exigua]